MSLLKVTTRNAGLDPFAREDETLVSGAGARWQAMSKQRPTPNPNKANLVGSWELGDWELDNLTRSLLALQYR
jgi:hypothetical protein